MGEGNAMSTPGRGIVLVQKPETEETFRGGKIIVPQQARDALAQHQVQIIEVGPPERCDNKHCARRHATDVSANGRTLRVHPRDERLASGAWALAMPRSLVDAGHDTEKLYFIRQSEVLGVFSTDSA